jgi:nitroreductase
MIRLKTTKLKENSMNFFDLLKHRKSIRKFTTEEITEEELEKILFAARSAPIGSNLYKDIHLTVVRNDEVLKSLSEATVKRIQDREKVQKLMGDSQFTPPPLSSNFFYGAPLVIFVSHRKQDIQPSIEYSNVACVTYSMHLATTDLGLGSVFIWAVLESMRKIPELDNTHLLELPEGFEPLLGLAIGHPVDKERNPREDRPDKITVNNI